MTARFVGAIMKSIQARRTRSSSSTTARAAT
jgi:hypothetical protein